MTVLLSTLALLLIGLTAGFGQANATTEPASSMYAHGVIMLDPCRVADSRDWTTLTTFTDHQSQDLVIGGKCGVPDYANGVILNVTVVPTGYYSQGGWLTVSPVGRPRPLVSQVTY